jgi:hypothetical protein
MTLALTVVSIGCFATALAVLAFGAFEHMRRQ